MNVLERCNCCGDLDVLRDDICSDCWARQRNRDFNWLAIFFSVLTVVLAAWKMMP